MKAYDQTSWTEQDTLLREDELDRERITRANAPDPDEEYIDVDDDDDDDLDLDDDDLDEVDTLGDDVDTDYDEDLDLDEDLDEDDDDLDDDGRIGGTGVGGRDFTASIVDGEDDSTEPNEIPEQEESDNEDLRYPDEQEVQQHEGGNDASFSEQTDVTPPRTKEFPDVGRAQTDFASRDQGRTTGRMIGHEPGTEGI